MSFNLSVHQDLHIIFYPQSSTGWDSNQMFVENTHLVKGETTFNPEVTEYQTSRPSYTKEIEHKANLQSEEIQRNSKYRESVPGRTKEE